MQNLPKTPRISIIVPSYQQGRFIGATIDSILAQDYPDTEIIVIDGGSTDDTVSVVESYGDRISYFVSETDRGQSHALNKGFAQATGQIMAWICSDDIYLPGAFRRAADFLTAHPEHDFIYGDGQIIDAEGKVVRDITSGPVLDRDNFHNYNYVFSTTAFWTRELWEKSGAHIDEDNNWTMDWELFIRMNMHSDLQYRPGAVACLRHHEDTKTGTGVRLHTARRNREIAQVSRRYGGPFCYNSVMHVALRIAALSDHLRGWPRPLRSALFRLLHLPVQILPGNRHSIFFNGTRIRRQG